MVWLLPIFKVISSLSLSALFPGSWGDQFQSICMYADVFLHLCICVSWCACVCRCFIYVYVYVCIHECVVCKLHVSLCAWVYVWGVDINVCLVIRLLLSNQSTGNPSWISNLWSEMLTCGDSSWLEYNTFDYNNSSNYSNVSLNLTPSRSVIVSTVI